MSSRLISVGLMPKTSSIAFSSEISDSELLRHPLAALANPCIKEELIIEVALFKVVVSESSLNI